MSPDHGKPHVTLVTCSEFWRNGAGLWARTREVVRFLATHARLRVVFAGPLKEPLQREDMAAIPVPFLFTTMGVSGPVTAAQQHAWLHKVLRRQPMDVCWVDKTELWGVLNLLPRGVRTIVDTHDLMSKRFQSFADIGINGAGAISEAEESAILARFDRVLCIQQEDRDVVSGWLGDGRALLAPHPATLARQALRTAVSSITCVGSSWIGNVDGMRWFLDGIWPQVARPGLHLDLYGTLCTEIAAHYRETDIPGLRLHGRVENLDAIYAAADIVINPVRAGAGLKIKSVEALANGLPLVTTREGARGLRFLDRRALWIADSAADFASALSRLVADLPLRQALGSEGFAYAGAHFTPEACFGEVLAWITEPGHPTWLPPPSATNGTGT